MKVWSHGLRLASVLAIVVASLAWTASAQAAPAGMRDVVLVGNAASGTVSFLDGHTWQNLGSIPIGRAGGVQPAGVRATGA